MSQFGDFARKARKSLGVATLLTRPQCGVLHARKGQTIGACGRMPHEGQHKGAGKMQRKIKAKTLVLATVAMLATGATGVLLAQSSGLTRTVVTKNDVSVAGREAVVARVEIAAGGVAGWHTHPGDEISYVTDGEATLLIAGQAPRKVTAGEAFVIPAGVVHNARNEGSGPARLVGVYVVEKGKPLASPAEAPK